MYVSVGAPGILAEAEVLSNGALSLILRDARGQVIASGLASDAETAQAAEAAPEAPIAAEWRRGNPNYRQPRAV